MRRECSRTRGVGIASAGLALLVLASPVAADSMRCGSKLVAIGDAAGEVLVKCGEPLVRQPVAVESSGRSENLVEQWTYHQGPGRFLKILTLEAGVVVRIDDGARQ